MNNNKPIPEVYYKQQVKFFLIVTGILMVPFITIDLILSNYVSDTVIWIIDFVIMLLTYSISFYIREKHLEKKQKEEENKPKPYDPFSD
jgi:hypothetical protein